MSVYYVVFDKFLHRGTEDFVAFLLCGIVPWLWFSRSVASSSRSIVGGKGLINQTYIPKTFSPLVAVGHAFLKQIFVFSLLIGFLVLYSYSASLHWLWLVPIVLTQLLLIIAVSFFVSFIVPFAHDLQYLMK